MNHRGLTRSLILSCALLLSAAACGPTTPAGPDLGYLKMSHPVYSPNHTKTIRLISNWGQDTALLETLRPAANTAAAQLSAITGVNFVVSGEVTPYAPTNGEIGIRIESGKCGANPDVWGCAPDSLWTQDVNGRQMLSTQSIYIEPSQAQSSSAERKVTGILHEIGHTLGMLHYNNTYQGSLQIMNDHITSELQTYQEGDKNGLRSIVFYDN
ncbi:MAG: hypothetical protein WBD02_01960 [Acidimicrobiia bacterium]